MLVQNSFAFSDSVLVDLVRGFYQLDDGGLRAWLRAFTAATLGLDKIKEFRLPSGFRI